MSDLPDYHFRTRENGAIVFRIDGGNRLGRIEMDQIAVVNVRNGEIKPHGDGGLSPEDLAAIGAWLEERRRILARREAEDSLRLVDGIDRTAHWVQSRASDADLDAVTDRLLLAMHDLRQLLVRRRAERMSRADPD